MLNLYEQKLYEQMISDEYSHEYLMDQLDINPGHVLYASYYNPSPPTPSYRYQIIKVEKGWELVDVTIRNNFYGCILYSNDYDLLVEERNKLINRQPTLFEVMEC